MSGFASAHHVLTFGAAGARGQTAAITALLERHGAYIEEFTVFDDVLSGRFYLRTAFRLDDPAAAVLGTLYSEYEALRAHYADAEGAIHDQQRPMRVLLMVSKADHCLRGLLDQWRRGELRMDIVGIASNHPDLAPLAAAEGLPYHHLPITPDTKPQQ
ncbi:MAG: formyltetrahydrofolate deformylase, partial [Thauera sp.]|nr:formyltetrahydrofolate deformylase [Thauera sp.]